MMLLRRYFHRGRHHHTPQRIDVRQLIAGLAIRQHFDWIEAMT